MWKLVLVHLEIMPIFTQDRCTVWAKHTIGSEIVLDAPDGTLGYKAQAKAHFGTFRDSANLNAG